MATSSTAGAPVVEAQTIDVAGVPVALRRKGSPVRFRVVLTALA